MDMKSTVLIAGMCLLVLAACERKQVVNSDPGKPVRTLTSYFDSTYLLYKLPNDFYKNKLLNNSFDSDFTTGNYRSLKIEFEPLGYPSDYNLQYTHVYSNKCVYHTADTVWKYAEVCFPNTCLTKKEAYAKVKVSNTTGQLQQLSFRLFYQNTSYWQRTDDSIQFTSSPYLDNYYGASEVASVSIRPHTDTVLLLPYSIGLNPKHEFDYEPSKDPARPGNYEFMLVYGEPFKTLLDTSLDLQNTNPFAEIQKSILHQSLAKNSFLYTGSHHFKFVFLDEYFDGQNDLEKDHVYIAKHGKEKKLCDTCTGWYRAVINEMWNIDDFSTGFIHKSHFVKADYGIRKENCRIDPNGVTLTIPASKRGDYKKTWGEFFFGPSFKYGHLTVRAKFAPLFTKLGYPTGIIHNLWLYQRDFDPVDSTNPWHTLVNANGVQPYEIDFEFWSCMPGVNTMWDDNAFINFSIVDYMRKPEVELRPGEYKQMGNYKAERLNERQAGIPGENLNRQFFDSFHTYELYWYPDQVRFLVDGKETGVITNKIAAIPNKYMFLWIGSPLYQDGTYYSQSEIPFLVHDKRSVIDYIRIE